MTKSNAKPYSTATPFPSPAPSSTLTATEAANLNRAAEVATAAAERAKLDQGLCKVAGCTEVRAPQYKEYRQSEYCRGHKAEAKVAYLRKMQGDAAKDRTDDEVRAAAKEYRKAKPKAPKVTKVVMVTITVNGMEFTGPKGSQLGFNGMTITL